MNGKRVFMGFLLLSGLAVNQVQAADIRVSGIYSDLTYIEEAGDLVGTELLIFPATGAGYKVLVQMAEGGAPESALVSLKTDGDKISIDIPGDAEGGLGGQRFIGTVTAQGIVGHWVRPGDPASSVKDELLKRGKSYWE